MKPALIRLSKFLSLILRHKPEQIGLSLDEGGWAEVEELLQQANQAGIPLTRELLQQVVEQNNKQRFTFSVDRQKIRANQGHSIPVDLGLQPLAPPEFLYHGTATRFLSSIAQHGLLSKNRNYVHLSGDPATALSVGKRHGEPVILTVKAGAMARDGYNFYRSANGIWLTEVVPLAYLIFTRQDDTLPDLSRFPV